jgi:hypothetical protein
MIKLYLIKKILTTITVLSIFFTYFHFLQDSYTQPFTVIFAATSFLFVWKDFLKKIEISDLSALLIFAFFGLTLFCLDLEVKLDEQNVVFEDRALKNLMIYISPILIIPSVFWLFYKERNLFNSIIRFGSVLWILVAFVQVFIYPPFMGGLVIPVQTMHDISDSGRGITGLAPESTHCGLFMLAISASLIRLENNLINNSLIFCTLLMSFFSFSTTLFLVLFIASLIYFLMNVRKSIYPLIFLALVFTVLYFCIITFEFEIPIRPYVLLRDFLTNPGETFFNDASAVSRIGGLFASFSYFLPSFFSFPNGLSSEAWINATHLVLSDFTWIDSLSLNGFPSGYGILIFQGGFISLLSIFWLLFKLCNFNLERNSLRIIILISFPIIFLFQFYISNPIFSLILGQAIISSNFKIENREGL